MFYLTLFSVALAVIFAGLFLSLWPRMRRAKKTNEKLLDRIDRLKVTQLEGVAENTRLLAYITTLEDAGKNLVLEVQRVDAIRKRTDGHCTELKKENDAMRLMVEHIDFTAIDAQNDPRTTTPSWLSETEAASIARTGAAANEPRRN